MENLNHDYQTVKFADGRRLGYAEYGPAEGRPVLYFHGNPSSRLELHLFEEVEAIATRKQARIMALDRPGVGISDFKPGRKFGDWPEDVAEFADRLKLDRFAVMGYSAGGPYVAATAWKIPERLTRVGLVSCTGPFTIPGAMEGMGGSKLYWTSAKIHPWLTQQMLKQMVRPGAALPPKKYAMMAEADYALLAQPGMYDKFVRYCFGEALCSDSRGTAYEASLYTKPWGFPVEAISVKVDLWHGELDQNAPIGQARYMAKTIPNCEARYYPAEGHISLFYKKIEEILGVLVS